MLPSEDHQRGSQLFQDGRFEETAERVNDWATVKVHRGDVVQAERGFRRALALEPQHSQAAVNLGVLLAGLRRFGEAIPWLERGMTGVDAAQRAQVQLLLTGCRKNLSGPPTANHSPAPRFEVQGQFNGGLGLITLEREGHQATFNGSWYRGEHTNFIPNKAELREPDAVDKHVLAGWLPQKPFIDKTIAITAFGSCFAAHISEHLLSAGYNVYGRNLSLDAHIVRFGEGMVNTFSIRQQFEWALHEREFPENLWFGAHKEIAAVDPAIRAQTYEIMRATKVFIITLGLSEIWYDKTTGDAFWRAIPAHLFDERIHGFRLSTPAENYDNLAAILRLIRKLHSDASVIFTLSPIPLMATFRPVSCLTANSVSKATLRVAIDQLMRDYQHDERLYYFPSYEIVTEFFTDPREEDNRHVRPELVAFIMETFRRHYCLGDPTVICRK